jgi:hypothetical protein
MESGLPAPAGNGAPRLPSGARLPASRAACLAQTTAGSRNLLPGAFVMDSGIGSGACPAGPAIDRAPLSTDGCHGTRR